ncbi:hypothetical protein DJ568_03845 [Mucilaginibacter hurinus]|uniref:Secretion system C-terminal sorting domain-containing protein n=1 Tax=Mucilaginibacter hurinus TaxID=2201324 RepID=A0A367GS43_9SPHI|nr:T9SS type A sorting domain-containing protein [Mucilaginibacter hurinus]RCH55895.1 hypothetical protein DJ568_03845 [Mucilaginibacter hurinus]
MRILLTFILLSIISQRTFAGVNMAEWRWRNNNGNEKTATWKAAKNLPVTVSDNQPFRLRINFINTNPVIPELTYSRSPGGPYIPIKNDNAGNRNAFVLADNNGKVTHWQQTTEQITDTAFNFYPGRIVTVADTTRTFMPDILQGATEFEWVIKPTKYIKPGTAYYFRSSGARPYKGGALTDIMLYTSSDIPHDTNTDDAITGFKLYSEVKNLIIQFSTRFDGHDKFEVEYSLDQKNWNVIKTIPGGDQHSYETTLPNPPAGITTVYARIKIFDREGGVITSKAVKQTFKSNAAITTFNGVKDGNKVKLNLGVAAEYINLGFEIGRTNVSNTSFTKIISIAGRGTANTAKTWTVFDDKPAMGFNKYVLKYYKDGVISYKLIEVMFGLGADAAIVKNDVQFSIYPNPTTSGQISFELKNFAGAKFTANLTNLYGKQVAIESFTANSDGRYVLKTNAAAGTYVLKLKSDGLAYTGKVVIL